MAPPATDRPSEMARDPFAEAEGRFQEIVATSRRENLSARAFRASVRALMVTDGDGRDWVLAPADGAWYRRDRDRWVRAEPPRRLVCPRCGHRNLTRHSFCVQCAGPLRADPAPEAPL